MKSPLRQGCDGGRSFLRGSPSIPPCFSFWMCIALTGEVRPLRLCHNGFMFKVLAAFLLVPLIELALLIEIGSHIGTLATVGLILATGALGAFLARSQGLEVLRRLRAETAAGRLPAAPLVDGVIILLAGAVLLTPGVLTDILGFLCLVPAFRQFLKALLWRKLRHWVEQNRVQVSVNL